MMMYPDKNICVKQNEHQPVAGLVKLSNISINIYFNSIVTEL